MRNRVLRASGRFVQGQRKSHYEENETERKQNSDLIETLKKEIKLRIEELVQARAVIGEEEAQIKKYLNDVCPIGNKTSDQFAWTHRGTTEEATR
ncbi:unnamed protein product, partial [Iphiclides podalirius]